MKAYGLIAVPGMDLAHPGMFLDFTFFKKLFRLCTVLEFFAWVHGPTSSTDRFGQEIVGTWKQYSRSELCRFFWSVPVRDTGSMFY